MTERQARAGRLLSAAAVGAAFAVAARTAAVGSVEDDAVFILLAKSLRHGVFRYPDPSGVPLTDPLPGFSALLTVPAWLVGPRWFLLKAIGVLGAILSVWLTRRLARKWLSPLWVEAVTLLVAFNPVLLGRAGLILPDTVFLAVSLAVVAGAGEKKPRWTLLAAGAAFAALLKPQGALLAAALALSAGPAAAHVALIGLSPLAVWLLRNRLVAGTATAYASHWAAGAGGADLSRFVKEVLGRGWLSVPAPWAALALLAAGLGAARLVKKNDRSAFVAAAYAVAVLALHATWSAAEPRYVILVLPFLWLFTAAALPPKGPVALAAAALLAAPAVPRAAAIVRAGWAPSAVFQPATMAFLRESLPADAVVETPAHASVRLLTGRAAQPPALGARNRDEWLASAYARGVRQVHVFDRFPSGGYRPPQAGALDSIGAWAQAAGARQVFRDLSEGAAVYELPAPKRFPDGWSAYLAGSSALRAGHIEEGRRELKRAVALEPTLAYAWASLAMTEKKPRERKRLLERAIMADPTAQDIAAELGR